MKEKYFSCFIFKLIQDYLPEAAELLISKEVLLSTTLPQAVKLLLSDVDEDVDKSFL